MNVLVVAPHPDDEILGVGGTMIKRIADGHNVYVCIVTRGIEPFFPENETIETRKQTLECHNRIGVKETFYLDFPSVVLDKEFRHEINAKMVNVIQNVEPDEVYIPHWGDMQKDHQVVTDACMVALRPKYKHVARGIYSYETLSETGWNVPSVHNAFIPNVYEDISNQLSMKLSAMKIYRSQIAEYPNPRSLEAVEALAKYRGSTVNLRAAEAFALIREYR